MNKNDFSLPEGTLVPNHVAIICDGNRRWARARNLPVFMGHQKGFDATPKIAKACRDFGIHTLTFWAFSTENWDRSKEEIAFLMKKYEAFVETHLREAKKEGVRIIHLGRKDRLPKSLVEKIIKAEKETKNNQKYILNIALDYGGRDEIIRATQRIFTSGTKPETITEKTFDQYLDTFAQPYPYPDLLIRPSGEQRTSGMFVWQGAYTEIYWLPNHFPSFTSENLREAIIDFSRRRRRFGGNDNVPKVKFDPKKVAHLEIGWWQAHHEGNKEKLIVLLTEWVKELYSLSKEPAEKSVGFLFMAVKYHNSKDWEKAVKEAENFYQLIKEEKGMVYQPKTAAQLEINWWKTRDELEDNLDKERLEKAFRDCYGEVYRLSDLQVAETAHFKALATFAHDLAAKTQLKEEQEKYWRQVEDYLVRTYQALRQIAS